MKHRGIRGETQRRYKNWIRDLYKAKGPGAPFTLREMMQACGTDFDGRQDYQAAAEFMMKMRRDFAIVMMGFFGGEDYDKYKAAGLSNEEMFRKLIEAALSENVYPVWADLHDEYRYKLFGMASFVELTKIRARSIVKELERKAEVMRLAFRELPELRDLYAVRPALSSDGVILQLPSGMECPDCGEHFGDPVGFVHHYNENHGGAGVGTTGPPPPAAPSGCPDCGGALSQMERGDWKCQDCKTVFDKDKIAGIEPVAGKRA